MQRIPPHLPIDILHLSDLHFTGGDEHADSWNRFLDHVRRCLDGGLFRPEVIAFTGDLVESPGRAAFQQGVNALLELAECCGFLSGAPRWKAGDAAPPPEWRELLVDRILMVPGNHDVYFRGLRMLKLQPRGGWDGIAGDAPQALAAGPLAVHLLDSNGAPAWLEYARGGLVAPASLAWPRGLDLSHRFRMALVHGHPVQLPYLLEGTDAETLMLMENAGLMLKNLATEQVRLVLHGHRHYPRICTLVLPDAEEASRPIVIVGAGSVTKPPRDNAHAYDWIRIHPDQRVEVTMATRKKGEVGFSMLPPSPYVADAGDFSYAAMTKRVEIEGGTGDSDVRVEIRGIRVHPGRPAVSSLPFAIETPLPATLTAWSLRVGGGGRPSTKLRWEPGAALLTIDPPHSAEDVPLDLEIRYHVHNGVALNTWEAIQMYGGQVTGRESIDLPVAAETGRLALEAVLPRSLAGSGATGRGWANNSRGGEDAGASDGVRVEFEPDNRRLSTAPLRPRHSFRYGLSWRLPDLAPPGVDVLKRLVRIQRMQANLVAQLRQGTRLLDDECLEVAKKLQSELPGADVCLYVGVNEAAGDPAGAQLPYTLHMVGANTPLATPFDQSILRFGSGIAGQALRRGKLISYNVVEAESTRRAYENGEGGDWESLSCYIPFAHEPAPYLAIVAMPVFPLALAMKEDWQVDVNQPHFTLGVLCFGSRDPRFPLLSWPAAQRDRFVAGLQQPPAITDGVEGKLWALL